MLKVTSHLWFSDKAEEAVRFYTGLISGSSIGAKTVIPSDTPSGPAGSVYQIEFTLAGQPFMALNAGDGSILWKVRLDASPSSSPITYRAGGKQFVAVVAGNGGPQAWPLPTPEYANPRDGTTLWVFELPGVSARVSAKASANAP